MAGGAEVLQLTSDERINLIRNENGGHPVMYGDHEIIRVRGDHREATAALLVLLPDAGDPQELILTVLEPQGDRPVYTSFDQKLLEAYVAEILPKIPLNADGMVDAQERRAGREPLQALPDYFETHSSGLLGFGI